MRVALWSVTDGVPVRLEQGHSFLRQTSNSGWSGTRRWYLTDCAGSVAKSPFRTGPESTLSV